MVLCSGGEMIGPLKFFLRRNFGFAYGGLLGLPDVSGMVKRISLRIIQIDIHLLNSSTWRQIYLRNALDDHRSICIIM